PKLTRFDAFICVSDATKQACVDKGFEKNKLFVVDNGVEDALNPTSNKSEICILNKYGINDDSIIILAIGRPVKRKGFSWFAQNVMPLLDDRFKFVHIGDVTVSDSFWFRLLPTKMQELISLFLGKATDAKALKDESKTNKNIILCGKVSDDDKVAIISNASVMVMPNIKVKGDMEGFGLVALEGSILGKTVLAANLEGITNAIHDGKNGFLLDSEKPEIWANRIKEISHNKVLFDAQVRDYTLQHFSWERMCLGYVQVFKNITKV
ncbi:MAG TPA: glycosyltransferase family 4 protein, partial [Saprospiraceae bacterium]|nr:glycosyltransferase family 4 protein [Saprospiraceae bacterium]